MSRSYTRRHSRARRAEAVPKPRGTFHPRVQKVGPEHFGIVSVDCAKARFLAVTALIGWATVGTVGQEKEPGPGARAGAPLTSAQLAERALHRRAVEAVIWGVPAVNFELLFDGLVNAKGGQHLALSESRRRISPRWGSRRAAS
jgi:hypothetical protein